jgi:hypothetical protein
VTENIDEISSTLQQSNIALCQKFSVLLWRELVLKGLFFFLVKVCIDKNSHCCIYRYLQLWNYKDVFVCLPDPLSLIPLVKIDLLFQTISLEMTDSEKLFCHLLGLKCVNHLFRKNSTNEASEGWKPSKKDCFWLWSGEFAPMSVAVYFEMLDQDPPNKKSQLILSLVFSRWEQITT